MEYIDAKELKLVLKKKWYDMIASGEKKEEYRDLTTFYRRRLETGWNKPYLRWRKYDIVTFYYGYAPDRPSMSFKYDGVKIGTGREEWGAEPGKEYYVIKLGERL